MVDHRIVRVSNDGHFLCLQDGKPFFWLADTAWELFHRLTREEILVYLDARSAQGFNVIQAVALAEFEGLRTPNAYGQFPLIDLDPRRPDLPGGSWDHVDWVFDEAAKRGIYIALLPTWGDKVTPTWGDGPVIFDADNIFDYGRWIGERYGNRWNTLWVIGGDRPAKGYESIWSALAEGVRSGESWRHLMTFHPPGGPSSSDWFHEAEWLDMNMHQSGHWSRPMPSYDLIWSDWDRTPVKPVLDGEPNYENHIPFSSASMPMYNAWDVRRASYWSVFAGGCGVTYGCHAVWQFMDEGREPINRPVGTWKGSLSLDGAEQIHHLHDLMVSLKPYFDRIPDQRLVVSSNTRCEARAIATRSRGGEFAAIYLPIKQKVVIDHSLISENATPSWFNPRTGESEEIPRSEVYEPADDDFVLLFR